MSLRICWSLWISESTGNLTAGLRPARIINPHLLPRGLQIPEDIAKEQIPEDKTKVYPKVFIGKCIDKKPKGKIFHPITKRECDSLVFVNFYLYLY